MLSKDNKYIFDVPITLKAEKGILTAHISSIEASKFGSSYGTPIVLIDTSDIVKAVSFDSIKFSVIYTTYTLQSDVSYLTYPFATESRPDISRLLAYRFRAYESVYNAYYRGIRNNPFVVDRKSVV